MCDGTGKCGVGAAMMGGGGQMVDPRYRQLTTVEVEKIAAVCHDANRAYCAGLGDTSHAPWEHAPAWQRESAIDGVAKQLEGGSGLKIAFGRSAGEESHNRWMTLKLKQGWRYGTEKDPAARVHPCLLPYSELPDAEKRKDELFRAIVIALDPRRPVEG